MGSGKLLLTGGGKRLLASTGALRWCCCGGGLCLDLDANLTTQPSVVITVTGPASECCPSPLPWYLGTEYTAEWKEWVWNTWLDPPGCDSQTYWELMVNCQTRTAPNNGKFWINFNGFQRFVDAAELTLDPSNYFTGTIVLPGTGAYAGYDATVTFNP